MHPLPPPGPRTSDIERRVFALLFPTPCASSPFPLQQRRFEQGREVGGNSLPTLESSGAVVDCRMICISWCSLLDLLPPTTGHSTRPSSAKPFPPPCRLSLPPICFEADEGCIPPLPPALAPRPWLVVVSCFMSNPCPRLLPWSQPPPGDDPRSSIVFLPSSITR